MGNIDLHIHSEYSDDGEFSIESLMRQAQDAMLNVAAIADHDSVKGCRERHRLAFQTDVHWIDAIEISCMHDDRQYHLLGYYIDPFDLRFDQLEETMRHNEIVATEERLYKLSAYLDVVLPLEPLTAFAKGKLVTGEVICEWLLSDENNRNHPLLRPYFPGGKRDDNPLVNFYWDFLSKDKVAYVPVPQPSFAECIRLIHDVGGIAVLAHPGNNLHEDLSILDVLVKLGLNGIEAYSSYHSEIQNVFYATYAHNHDLAITCGSDYHGKTKPKIKLGLTHCPLSAEEILVNMERGRK